MAVALGMGTAGVVDTSRPLAEEAAVFLGSDAALVLGVGVGVGVGGGGAGCGKPMFPWLTALVHPRAFEGAWQHWRHRRNQ